MKSLFTPNKSLLKIGLTGGIGCGKSTAVDAFRALGADIIDADKISKDLVKTGNPVLAEIVRVFDKSILLPNGDLNRDKLKEIVFSDAQALQKLEVIIHPEIRAEINHQIAVLSDSAYVIVDIPLLLEKNYSELFDRIVIVDCLPEQQIKRVIQRDELDVVTIKSIIKTQVSRKTRLIAATDVLDNSGNINTLKDQVENLHKDFLTL
ncbi:MAG TPA: dephospho-CoA kinase [Leucothrix sp.]|nr:dephospho-CoA kinase [Leucothrix sp.]